MVGHVGLIGYGAVAQEVQRVLAAHPPTPRLTVLLRLGSPSRVRVPASAVVVDNLSALLALRPDLVVEAAGQHAVVEMVAPVLAAGVPVLIVSTGAFAEPGLLAHLSALAETHGARLRLSAGAVGGLDYLDAASLGEDLRVRYTSRKPPAAWRAELAALGREADELAAEVLLFEGTPEEAVRRYPRNLNVALTLRLRLGPAASMTVRVVADPQVARNTHEIDAASNLGTAQLRFANVASAGNPKTSALTGHMVAAEIRDALASTGATPANIGP
jgi:aspartate dehydrogenase